ncbi:FecR domain-containing protein [Flavobacterium galactosidilyticum]|uniref:FecR family protein n=1 Tax=Flavobacterium galactosidilyticum TaxID=2893886 RepID=UPI001E4F02FE|nr:FecR family protein [Flavobacterium sp. F-340]UFH45702.1 FecR domain-containing protein [Flavobacterium sp. F-340]
MITIPLTILEILSAYISKEITENEFAILKEWIDEGPENKQAFSEYLLFYKKTRQVVFTANTNKDNAWDTIVSQLERPLQTQEKLQKIESKVRFLQTATTILKYAAVVIVLVSVGYFYFGKDANVKPIFENSIAAETAITLQLANGDIQIINEDGTTQVVDANGNVVGTQKGNQLVYTNASAKDTLVYNTIKVPYGKRFELKLSDGTDVHLNAGTSLKYPVRFINGENRQVFLNGEAFFEVTKDAKHPFVVGSNDMNVKVLGTKFNVTSYKEDAKTYTVLVEGSVVASNKVVEDDNVILKPGNRVFFENKHLKTETVDVRKYIAWVTGELMFIDDSFGVITNKLERKYNVDIVNKYDELNDIMVTATFKEENIDQVLKTFQTYKAFNYTINNRVITITKPKNM